ncbi:MAG: hypothetical protein ACQERD_10365 [Campylobacterota bacterium]
MKLEYAGLKPMISEHGINFKDGKEDKYKYLEYAAEILEAIDHDYERKEKYSHKLKDKSMNSKEILDLLLRFHPNLEDTMNNELQEYYKHLDEEEEHVEQRSTLKDIEKEAYVNNLEIMKDYKIQRAKNKIFYFHCIETIAQKVIQHKIKELDTPFNERFWHVLQSIQGQLSTHKISSNLKTIDEDDSIQAILKINIY